MTCLLKELRDGKNRARSSLKNPLGCATLEQIEETMMTGRGHGNKIGSGLSCVAADQVAHRPALKR